MKKAIAFDLGNVVFGFDYQIALEKIKDKVKVSCEEIIQDLFFNNFATDFEKGLISAYDFYLKFKNAYSASITYEEFVDIWSKIFFPRKETIELIEKLNIIYPVYLISNINELHFQYLYKTYPRVFSLFDELILSFKLKSIKPERKIYEKLKRISQLEYQNIIYIDDRQDLISEAKKLDLNCIRFTNLENLINSLTFYDVVIPTRDEKEILEFLIKKISLSKNPLVVGIGNTLRSDDGVGVDIVENLKSKTFLKILNVESTIENYLDKLRDINFDFLLIVDAAKFSEDRRFSLFKPEEIKNTSLYFTHNTSLKLTIEYLKKEKTFDILILGIKTNNFSLGKNLSQTVIDAKIMIENFFLKNFSSFAKCKD
jgi:hydrogenase maturation protease